jgi:aldehyde:ferredoxin oxidoreductase
MFIHPLSDVPFTMAGDGYADRILRVNLSQRTVGEIPYQKEWKEHYIGGRGLGVRLVFDLVDPATDPLSDGNAIILAAGPLTGSGMPLGSRYSVIAKSPLTGTLSSSSSGGFFGTELRRAGIDAVLVEGRSIAPVYLWIQDGECEIRDASPYWGMTTDRTMDEIQRDLAEPKARVSCIGPAGERLARIAAIMNDHGRAAGRGGMGAVFGSKRLKAIAVLGDGKIPRGNPEEFSRVRDAIRQKIEKSGMNTGGLRRYGTAASMNLINEAHLLPTRNFQASHFDRADAVSGERMRETSWTGSRPATPARLPAGGRRGPGA